MKPQHSLLEGDRLKRELEAQRKRAEARAYVEAQGVMHDSVVERVLNKGSVTRTEARELSLKTGESRDNTLELLRGRATKSKEQELKAKLARQQADFRVERDVKASIPASEGGAERTQQAQIKPPMKGGGGPLPPGWQEVKDPNNNGEVYYWHTTTNETRWERPVAEPSASAPVSTTSTTPSLSSSAAAAAAQPPSTSTAAAAALATVAVSNEPQGPSLPAGWKEVKHPATGQIYYLHDSGKKRWDRPTADDEASDILQKQKEHAASVKAAAKAAAAKGGIKRPRPEDVDPLDPTGGRGGRWGDGISNLAERMADSTASGSLWQQRPLPAPGAVLKGRFKK